MLSDYLLPVVGGYLRPCTVPASELMPVPGGHHCASCQRVVHNFFTATSAEVAAAGAASPDGRLCGRFRVSSTVAPTFTRRLRWFVVALVLVVGQGLTAREALAQVRRGGIDYEQLVVKSKAERIATAMRDSTALADTLTMPVFGMFVEQMPSFRGGGNREIIQYIQQQIVWPKQERTGKIIEIEGRVYVSFTVMEDGKIQAPQIVKGLHPLFDAEVLRVLRTMPSFTPGQQNGKPVSMSLTLPITFRLK